MSAQSQKKFLKTLLSEIEAKDVEAYRRATADKQHHNFTLSRRAIRKGIKDYLRDFHPELTKTQHNAILKQLDPSVKQFIKKVGDNLVTLAAKDDTVSVTRNTLATKQATFEVKQGKSRYDKVYSRYSQELKTLIGQLSIVVGREAKSREVLNLSHADFEGIIESAVADALDKAVEEDGLITQKMAEGFLAERGVDLKVIRDTKTSTMNVSLASSAVNAADKDASKARIAKLRQALEEALQELSDNGILADLPGSDSFKKIKEKEVINDILDPFRRIKNVTVSKKNKIKHSKTNTSQKVTGSPKVAVVKAKARRAKARRKQKAGAASRPLELLGVFNQRLPETVRRNMQEPALVNRTGTFASSVKVTEIQKTPKGFPSIGYTYKRDPYEVFEVGSGNTRATPERDPRILIDKSIREIAAQFAIGRFYTRRV